MKLDTIGSASDGREQHLEEVAKRHIKLTVIRNVFLEQPNGCLESLTEMKSVRPQFYYHYLRIFKKNCQRF